MFESYPKIRSKLPPEYQRVYEQHYKSNRSGDSAVTGIAQKLERWMHKRVAADIWKKKGLNCPTLEIGAGTLNHLSMEKETTPYDIVEPFESLFEESPRLKYVRDVYADISEIDESLRYKRIISIATFEHVCNLPHVVAKCGLLLERSGTLRVAIPSEGTLLWRIAWMFSTGLEFRLRYGLNYGVLMKHEHVNTAEEVNSVLTHFFSDVSRQVMGASAGLSLYQFFQCANPNVNRCRQFLTEDS